MITNELFSTNFAQATSNTLWLAVTNNTSPELLKPAPLVLPVTYVLVLCVGLLCVGYAVGYIRGFFEGYERGIKNQTPDILL